tara:strand:- start:68 stop:1333 length:1266 start_codon:yes stop_codon:yes gene_type:complete
LHFIKKVKNSLVVRNASLIRKKGDAELINIASTKSKSGDYKAAIEGYTKIMLEFPSNILLHKYRGDAYFNLKEYKSAVNDYNHFISKSQGQSERKFENYLIEAYCSRGEIKFLMNDYIGAKTDFFRGTYIFKNNHSNKHAHAFFGIGKSCFYLNYFDEALDKITRAINLGHSSYLAYFLRGSIFYNNNYPNEAIRDFKKALKIDPSNLICLKLKMNTHYKCGNFGEALKDCTSLINCNYEKINNLKWSGCCKTQLDDYQSAINDFTEAIRLDPNNYSCYILRSNGFRVIGNNQDALIDLNQAIKLNPKSNIGYYWRAKIKLILEDKQGALIDSQKSMDINNYGYGEKTQYETYLELASLLNSQIKKKLNQNLGPPKDLKRVHERFLKEINQDDDSNGNNTIITIIDYFKGSKLNPDLSIYL